jgi:hypothetical protein
MLANQDLRKTQKLAAQKEARIIKAIEASLMGIDPNVKLLPIEKALVSQTIVNKLWDILPDEHLSYHYASVEELKINGQGFLIGDPDSPVILHFGWDVLAVTTTLRAAWEAVTTYSEISIDTYNTCIYPASLDWYVIRAGTNLYPMDCLSGDTATILKLTTDY